MSPRAAFVYQDQMSRHELRPDHNHKPLPGGSECDPPGVPCPPSRANFISRR